MQPDSTMETEKLHATGGRVVGVSMTVDNAVVTVEGGGVYLYELGSRHLEATWSVRPGTHFATAAVLLPGGESQEDGDGENMLVAAKGERGIELCGWRADEEDELGSSWMVKTEQPVLALQPVPGSSQVAVFLEDGSACLCAADASLPEGAPRLSASASPASNTTLSSLLSHDVTKAGRGHAYLVAFCSWSKGSPGLQAYRADLDALTLEPCGRLDVPEGEGKCVAVASCASARRWASLSGKELRVYGTPPYPNWEETGAEVFPVASCRLSTGGPLSLCFLQNEALAIFGAAQEGAQIDTAKALSVWHSEFATPHMALELKEVELGSGEKKTKRKRGLEEDRVSLVSCLGGMGELLLATTSQVYLQTMPLPRLSLASAMGSLARGTAAPPMVLQADLASALGDGMQISSEKMDQNAVSERWEAAVKADNDTLSQVIDEMQNPKTTEKKLLSKLEDHLASGSSDEEHIPMHMVSALCDRCCGPNQEAGKQVDSSPIFAPKVLGMLIKKGLVSARLHSNVIPRCIASGAIGVLVLCLRHTPDLPEHTLVRVIRYFASEVSDKILEQYHAESFAEGKKQKKAKSSKCNPNAVRERLIARCLGVKCSSGFLVPCLQSNLSEADIHMVLRVLHWWLVQYNEAASQATSVAHKGRGPTHAQCLDWTAMMLDACFGSVVLSTSTAAIAAELKKLVDEQVALCEALHSLEEFRRITKGAATLIPAVPEYSVEVLYL